MLPYVLDPVWIRADCNYLLLPGRTGRSSSRGSSSERPSSTSMFIREGSLKAQKLEMDALKAEQDEGERQKSEKRARSAAKKV